MRTESGDVVARRRSTGTVVVSGLASDAHTWNLVYLQLVLEEMGHRVTNLGACVPSSRSSSSSPLGRPDHLELPIGITRHTDHEQFERVRPGIGERLRFTHADRNRIAGRDWRRLGSHGDGP